MRARLAATVVAGVTLLAVAGCARIDLVDAWPTMAEPTGWEPRAGVCTEAYSESSPRGSYKPLDCTTSHGYETVHVGKFTGEAAALGAPPEAGSPALAGAWADCDTKTTEYVGAPWRDGMVWIAVSVPSEGAWDGGARWYRCEAAATTNRLGEVQPIAKSLKGLLASDPQMMRGCFKDTKDDDKPLEPIACTEGHNAEYVGSFISNDSWDALGGNLESAHKQCRSLVAGFVGVPDDNNMKYRTGTLYLYPAQADWDAGDRGVRCHLWLDKNLTSSLKGGGTKALPINYG